MATLSQQDSDRLLKQIKTIQDKINQFKQSQGFQPEGQITPTAAQIGGARGLGFDPIDDDTTKAALDANAGGVPMSALGDTNESGKTNLERPESFQAPRVSAAQSQRFVKSFGLEGIVNSSAVSGMTSAQANRFLLQEKSKRTGQVSANTSFAFNPETLNRTQRAIDKFGFALDEVDNDPFEPKEFKDQNRQNAIENAQREIGNLFNNQEDFLNAAQNNPAFQATLNKFIEQGGTTEGISRNITAPVVGENNQDPASFLAGLNNPQADQEAERLAIEELAPESEIAQAEIARISNIPDDLKRLYFGDAKTIGILEMRQKQGEEEVRILEEQEKDANRTVRERASLAVDKNKAEVKVQKAKIEENRLRAKNYMTAQLAKLGALKTTGAAPLALQTLDTKYEGQVIQLETSYDFASRAIQIGLDEDLDKIENGTDSAILKVQEDLTLDAESMTKEVMKLQQSADKETYRITEQYARRLRTRTTKYTDDLKKAAEKYAKAYAKSVGGVDPDGVQAAIKGGEIDEGQYVPKKGILRPDGTFTKLKLTPTQEREVDSANLRGASTVKFFVSRPTNFKRFIIENQIAPDDTGFKAEGTRSGDTFLLGKEDSQFGSPINSGTEIKEIYKNWLSEEEGEEDDFEDFYDKEDETED